MKNDFSIFKHAIYNIKKSFESFMNIKFSNYEVTAGQAQFLHILSKEGSLKQSSLSKIADCDKSYTHRVVGQLLEKQLITRLKNENDLSKLSLTEKGRLYANDFEKYANKWQKLLLKEIGIEELKIVKKVLVMLSQKALKIINNMEKKK